MSQIETKTRILQNARELFRRKGIRSVRMEDIANHLGISKKTLYQHYKDKKNLIIAIAEYDIESHINFLRSVRSESINSIEIILRTSEHFFKDIANINPAMISDVQRLYPEAWEKFKEKKNELFTMSLVQTLSEGKQQGLFRSEIHPEIMAKLRLAQIELAFNSEIFPFDKYNFLEVHKQFFFHFLWGICTEKGLKLMEEYSNKNLFYTV
ncbi:MAG: TetR/AcrR family transcriptional regulator [Cytophagales bacterium]|nr:TetR/AcrR family transcriptional regulator [Cytophagales bacterium]MDW8383649.1 TetR/AcrR family transcriptional regulator [Flammeovirgaceae bacterium]